jgi:hypothetical protein
MYETRLCQWEITGKMYNKNRRLSTDLKLMFATNLANKPSPQKSMHRLNGEFHVVKPFFAHRLRNLWNKN